MWKGIEGMYGEDVSALFEKNVGTAVRHEKIRYNKHKKDRCWITMRTRADTLIAIARLAGGPKHSDGLGARGESYDGGVSVLQREAPQRCGFPIVQQHDRHHEKRGGGRSVELMST